MPEGNFFPSDEEENLGDLKEFISPDKKLKIEYFSNWTEMRKEDLKIFNQEAIKEGAEILLFAQKFKIKTSSYAFLAVQELNSKEKENIEKFVEKMKKGAEEKGGEMEITKIDINDNEANLETKYIKKEGNIILSKEKIILTEKKVYLITIGAPEKDWQEFEKEIDQMIQTIQLLK